MFYLKFSSTRNRVFSSVAGKVSRQRSRTGPSSRFEWTQDTYYYSSFAEDDRNDKPRYEEIFSGPHKISELYSLGKLSSSITCRDRGFRNMGSGGFTSLGSRRNFSSSPAPPFNDEGETNDKALEDILDKLSNDNHGSVEDGTTQLANATVELSNYNPADLMLQLLSSVHDFAGPEVPYALVIFGVTVAIRTAFLPLAISQQRNASRMAHMKPEMELMKERMERIQAQGAVTPDMNIKMANEMKGLFNKYECNPLKSFILPLVQFPTFMSMFFALRKMPDVYPEDMLNGGLFWFTDLSSPDPYLIMPFISAGSFLLMIEMTKENMMATNPAQGKMFVTVFRGLSVFMVPLTMNFPASLFCYWVTNNVYSLGQTILFKVPALKKSFGIWDPPKPVPGAPPQKGFMEELKSTFTKQNEQAKLAAAAKAKKDVNYALPEPDPQRRVGTKKERLRRHKERLKESRRGSR